MTLIYCTSVFFPSGLADRLQILAMAKAFARKLKDDFYLGVAKFGPGSKDYLQYLNELNKEQILTLGLSKSYILALKYLKFIKKNKIQYIYCREPRLLLFLIFYVKLFLRFKTEFIYEVHLILERGFLDRVVERLVARWSDYFVFITKHLADLYIKKYKIAENKTLVAPDGVDLELFDLELSKEEAKKRLNLPSDKKVIGFFGRFKTMEQEKGLATILCALKLLPEDIILLGMGGKPRHREEYLELAKKLRVGDRVLFVEHFNQKEVAWRQKACDVLLMPFPRTQHYAFYMSPLKMFEYMAAKRPIIASGLPSVREVLNERNAFFVRPDEPADLARAIMKVLEDKELAQRISQRAYLDVQNYTWQKRVEKIIGFIADRNPPNV